MKASRQEIFSGWHKGSRREIFPEKKAKFIQNSLFDKSFIKGAFLFIVLFRGKTIIRSSNENKRKYGRAGRRVCEARPVGKGKSICITQVVIMKHSHVRKNRRE